MLEPHKITYADLSLEQQYAFDSYKEGHNLFITGPGGSGKSALIHSIINDCRENHKRYQVCALTGCASVLLNCGATTLHSFFGLGLAKGPKAQIIDNVTTRKKYVMKAIRSLSLLIIDEVSMMSAKLFEIIDEISRIARIHANFLPFGGVQIILTGDFFQLPPIGIGTTSTSTAAQYAASTAAAIYPKRQTFKDITTMMTGTSSTSMSMSATELDDGSSRFCFEAPLWKKIFRPEDHIELCKVFRQTDEKYREILNEIRFGSISKENADVLFSHVNRTFDAEKYGGITPTKILPTRLKVDQINANMYSSLPSESVDFKYRVFRNATKYIDSEMPIDELTLLRCSRLTPLEVDQVVDRLFDNTNLVKELKLKIGAVVMCTHNLNMELGICNGSQGIITDIVTRPTNQNVKIPKVRFTNGLTMFIDPMEKQDEEYPAIVVAQVPLRLAWAITIHKSQGATLDLAEIDVGREIFESGQTYVALSRVRSLDGLYLSNFDPKKIRANPLVVAFYRQIPKLEFEFEFEEAEANEQQQETIIKEEIKKIDFSKFNYNNNESPAIGLKRETYDENDDTDNTDTTKRIPFR